MTQTVHHGGGHGHKAGCRCPYCTSTSGRAEAACTDLVAEAPDRRTVHDHYAMLSQLKPGDTVLLTRDERTAIVQVQRNTITEPGAWEHKHVTVGYGPGRFNTEVSAAGMRDGFYDVEPIPRPVAVLGPGRPRAAAAAISEMHAAQERARSDDSKSAARRLAVARVARAQYGEYSDDFRGY